MLKSFVVSSLSITTACAALVACSSSPKSGTQTATDGTHFHSPMVSSRESFQADPKKYSKEWVEAVNAGILDNYKKVVIPAYTVNFHIHTVKAENNKLAAAFVKADGAKSVLTMGVSLPHEQYETVMQEIAKESHERLKQKFAKMGVEVLDWQQVRSQNEEAQDFEKKRLKNDPVYVADGRATFTAPGTARLDSIFWSAGAAALSRDLKATVIMPNYTIGYGYFGGEKTAATITEAHDMAKVEFTPQVQLMSGSGFIFASKYEMGRLTADHTAVNNGSFVKKLIKQDDTRSAASTSAENSKSIAAGFKGGTAQDYVASSRAAIQYQMDIDAAQFKKLVMQEMDLFEDALIQRYAMEM